MRQNRVLANIRAGKPAFGTFLSLGSTLGAEQLAHTGFDWLVIETEHHPIGPIPTMQLLQAISTTDTTPLVRVPGADSQAIKAALDLGAYGVVVPMVKSVAQAELVVEAGRYPPLGGRGIGGARRTLYGGPDYTARANEEIALIVMIEHVDAVERAEDILSVPGIDAWFLGPSDLCLSMGLDPVWDPDYPEYHEAVAAVVEAGRRAGVPGGIHTTAGRVREAVAQGFLFIAVGYDLSFMAAGAAEALAATKAALDGESA